MDPTMQLVVFFTGQLVIAASIWGAVRADIRNIHDKIALNSESIKYAHARIDSIINLELMNGAKKP